MSEDMRMPADWMQRGTDDAILEHLRDNYWGTAQTIAPEIDRSEGHVGARLRELCEHRLIDRPARGVYVPNDNTIAYLDEELDASGLAPRED